MNILLFPGSFHSTPHVAPHSTPHSVPHANPAHPMHPTNVAVRTVVLAGARHHPHHDETGGYEVDPGTATAVVLTLVTVAIFGMVWAIRWAGRP